MKHLVLYTMNGCHFCGQFKDMLKEQEITFMDRDIMNITKNMIYLGV